MKLRINPKVRWFLGETWFVWPLLMAATALLVLGCKWQTAQAEPEQDFRGTVVVGENNGP